MDIDPSFVRNGLLTFIVLLASLALHEWAHAVVADMLGDDTPRLEGRVTLNPMAHIDLIGTVVMPLLCIFVLGTRFAFIGWAKPVMVNASNFRNPRRDEALVTLAGPAANAAIALIAVVAGSFLVVPHPVLAELVARVVMMNVGLAVFNMLPIPPLDGGLIFSHIVGMSRETFLNISRYSGIFILIAVNIEAVRYGLAALVAVASIPYWMLCGWISPLAQTLIFPL
jgi:Zn-dependent protease